MLLQLRWSEAKPCAKKHNYVLLLRREEITRQHHFSIPNKALSHRQSEINSFNIHGHLILV